MLLLREKEVQILDFTKTPFKINMVKQPMPSLRENKIQYTVKQPIPSLRENKIQLPESNKTLFEVNTVK
jgi:hypothetical protein